MTKNQAYSLPAAYGQKGVQLFVEGGNKIRVWGDAEGMSAEVHMSLTEAQGLSLAAQLLMDLNQDELASAVQDLAKVAYQNERAEA